MSLTPTGTHSVLLVDDDPIQLKLTSLLLGQAGFEVRTTTSAAEALEMARKTPPHAIVSDVLMGDLDGFALCRTLRAEPGLAGVPVVLVSAQFQEEDDRKLAMAVGASALVERSPDFTSEVAALMRSLNEDLPAPNELVAIPHLYVQRVASQLTRLLNKSRNSEIRYRALIENANDAISVLTPDGFILEINRRQLEMLQYPSEQVIGHHIREFAAPGFERENVDQYQTAMGDASGRAHAFPLRRADGKIIYVAFTTAPVTIDGQSTVLSIGRDVTDSVESARKLRESEENYRSFIENSPDVIWSATRDGTMTFISPNVTRMFGMTSEEIISEKTLDPFMRVAPEDQSHVRQAHAGLLGEGKPFDVEYRVQRRDDEWIWVHNRATIVHRADRADRVEGVLTDITARKRLELQLLQSQKMEAVGQLTGGVAHDFNNILAAILANSHFLIEDLGEQDPRRADAEEIKKSAERAASLTRQLLAFSRRQVLSPIVLDLNTVTSGVEKMLRRVIGEDIDLSIVPAQDLGSVRADAGQLEQVIMNLVVNARDAMPTGGKLTIETANVELDDQYAGGHVPMSAGRYVMIAVSDTGCGMDEAIKSRIFEPFFTTKDKSKGTGLGLSTSYGIVKQSGGFIWVYSEPRHGTVFKIYLPRIDASPATLAKRTGKATDLTGTETILVVEDDERVRVAVRRMLKAKGYHVLVAQGNDEALAICGSHAGHIDMVLSDVIIPGVSGPEIVHRVRTVFEGTRALYMSGYTDHAILRGGALEIGMSFIQKPFAPEALAKKVREVLDA